jgi:hypothetical protein
VNSIRRITARDIPGMASSLLLKFVDSEVDKSEELRRGISFAFQTDGG